MKKLRLEMINSMSGFTIVELLVAVSIMGLVAVGVMNLNYFLQKETRSSFLRAEINFFDQKVSQLLAIAPNCEATIGAGTTIPLKGSNKAALNSIRTSDNSIVFQVSPDLEDDERLDKMTTTTNEGAVSKVWIAAILIGDFQETDYVEADTTKEQAQGSNYATFDGANRYGWAVIDVIYAVKQMAGSNEITRRVKAEYPVPVIVTPGRGLVRCVDSSMRSSAAALETLCVDLGGSVTFREEGEPECHGTGENSGFIGVRTLCADFGGTVVDRNKYRDESPDFDVDTKINTRHYSCKRSAPAIDCQSTEGFFVTSKMEFKCLPE